MNHPIQTVSFELTELTLVSGIFFGQVGQTGVLALIITRADKTTEAFVLEPGGIPALAHHMLNVVTPAASETRS